MTLVKKTFLVFLIAFVIQLAIVALLIGFGYRQSETQWSRVRDSQAYSTARSLLLQDSLVSDADSYDGQLAIYDADRQLLQSTRGMGMHGNMGRNMLAQLKPIQEDGKVVGYYATGDVSFGSDTANKTLIQTMIVVLFISLVLSFGISIIAALYFSRRVSRPADHLARSLSKMTSGDLSSPIVPEGSDELIQIAQSIERLRVNLIGEQTVRSQWSQDIAHDLRTPVASVKAQLEGMIDGVLQPDVPRFERTMRELERMEVLIQDLEMLMRLESPETEVHYEKIPVVHFLRDLSDQFDAQLQRKSMKLVTHSRVEFLVGDAVLLSRAVANLIHNAIRYGNDETEITVSVHQQGNGIEIRVHNVGNPIPLQDISKLTERMYRGEYARSTPGSGLGLTIVDRIVKLHGGLLSIVSSEDDGTCFSFIVPTSSTI